MLFRKQCLNMWIKSAFCIASHVKGHRALRSKRLLRTAFQTSRNFSEEKHDYDVIIVGGGMVGGAMACALGMVMCRPKMKGLLNVLAIKVLHEDYLQRCLFVVTPSLPRDGNTACRQPN